jgi:hypothetical protein
MAFYRKHVTPALVKYQLWIFKRHNWKYKFLRLKRTPDEPRAFSDDTRDLLRDKLKPPDRIQLNAFLQRVNPIRKFRNIKELWDPGLFKSKRTRRERKKTCKSVLVSAQKLRSSTSSYENATKITGPQQTIYFSRKDNELPIVIDTGASVSVTPSLDDFLGPIWPCTTKELNGLNSSITVVGVGTI